MKKVLIYVEGQTEETFVQDVLAPYLARRCQIYLIPTLAWTKRTKAGHTFKGGIVSYAKVKADILRLLQDASATLVTTMIDYYGLPDKFPGKNNLPPGIPYQRVAHLEEALAQDIGRPCRFLPFLVLHEFEAFILVNPESLGEALPQHRDCVSRLREDIGHRALEEINEGRETHPAVRIRRYFPAYRKALHGPLITKRLGLDSIRHRCPHFNRWLQHLESLCQAS